MDAEVTLALEPDHLAERLRIRKGSLVRFTRDGEVTNYRVLKVSMPDQFDRCTVSVESA